MIAYTCQCGILNKGVLFCLSSLHNKDIHRGIPLYILLFQDYALFYVLAEEEVQGLLQFRKRGYYIKNKKGKGSYERKPKHRNKIEE